MSIFNSLGSNYDFASALQMLFATGNEASRRDLTDYLEERYSGKAVLIYKGREALTLALSALNDKGSVVMNGFTCLAVYESIIKSGHAVRYLDIVDGALDFSFETFQSAVEANADIKAVVVQNTLGIPCDIAPIATLCKERGIALIEDLAHSIGAQYADGHEAGTVGDFVVLSFSQDKVVDAVSGGALIIRNPKYSSQTAVFQLPFSQQIKDRLYPMITWKIRLAYAVGIGKPYHWLMRSLRVLSTPFGNDAAEAQILPDWYCTNILRQFQALEKTAKHRNAIANVYAEHINKQVQLQFDIQGSSNLRFPILVQGRDRLIKHLKGAGVHVSDIWYDAPVAPKKYIHRTDYKDQCPEAEIVSNEIVNLPTHINVSPAEASRIAQIVNEWLESDMYATYSVGSVERDAWEAFIMAQKPHSFLQSWGWGEQYEAAGSKVFRIGIRKGEGVVALALFILVRARRGSFLLCPHGPVISASENGEELLRIVAREATRIARAEECDFLRFCPLAEDSDKNRALYRELGFRGAPIHMHPELSWMLDVTKSEDDLLREMRKTTRYLVKKMEKDGVKITMSTDPNDIEKFWPVYQATVDRQHFTPFSKNDLRTEFSLFAKHTQAAFFFGTYREELIAAAIIIFYNGQAFYHHSGSIQKSKDINASYLLQWHVIQEAKRRGCTLYNFWGISPADNPEHPWAGLSLFKKGFGGFAEAYLHAQDKPLTAKYALNYAVETARRIRRGL